MDVSGLGEHRHVVGSDPRAVRLVDAAGHDQSHRRRIIITAEVGLLRPNRAKDSVVRFDGEVLARVNLARHRHRQVAVEGDLRVDGLLKLQNARVETEISYLRIHRRSISTAGGDFHELDRVEQLYR